MSEINAGELILELRAETSAFLNDIRNAGKQAADQIASDLRNALNQSASSQNQVTQSIQQQNQEASQQLNTLKQQYQIRIATAEINKRSLEIEREQAQLDLQALQAEKQALQIQKQSSAALEDQIAERKRSLANLDEEIEKTQKLRIEAEKYRQTLREAGTNSSSGLAAVSIYQSAKEMLSERRLSARYAEIENEKQASIKATLDQSLTAYKAIETTLAKSAEYSRSLRDQTSIDILKTQSSRATESNLIGGGLVSKAEANRTSGIKLEELRLEQQLTSEKKKYLSDINQVVTKGREYISLLQQTGASEQELSQAKDKQKAQVQALMTSYKQLRGELKDLSAERIKNIDAEFDKAKSESSRLKFFFKEIGEGLANQIGSGISNLVTSLITTPVNLAINLLRSAVSGIIGQISASLDAFKQYESLKSTTNIATQGQGAKAVPFLEQVSDKYKYPVLELAKSYNLLSAAMLGAGKSLDETNYVYERLVLSGRALSMSTQDIEGIVNAVSQSFSKGKVQAEELRGQLGDRFPGAVTLMAQALGVTTAELDKMMQAGELTADVFFAFARQTEQDYKGRVPEALNTTEAAALSLQNQITKLRNDFGEAIDPINRAALESASEILENISRGAFTQIRQRAEEIRNYLNQNPQIIANISSRISELLTQGLNKVADKAKELLEYLDRNPDAIDKGLERLTSMAETFGKLVNYAGQFAQWLVSAAENMEKFMAIPGVKEFLFGNPTQDLNRGALGQGITEGKEGFKSGLFTGPSANIGGSSEYHVDVKLSSSLSDEEQVKLFDQMAHAYYKDGRVIEFSNPGVAGQQYDLNDPKRGELLKRVRAAHSHSVSPGWNSFDFYAPKIGENRFSNSVEGAEMTAPNIPGGRVNYASGGNYGNHLSITDSSGREIFKMGHGDDRKPLPANRTLGGSSSSSSPIPSNPGLAAGSSAGGTRSSSGMLANLPASKTAPPVSIAQGKNANAYLSRLAFLESTFNTNAYNEESGAAGAFQFTPATVTDALKAGIADPTKGDLNAQATATLQFIKKFHPEAHAAILKGDWNTADRLLKGRWSALPGGGESQSSERMRQGNAFLNGGTSRVNVNLSANEADQSSGTSGEELANRQRAEFRQYQSDEKKAKRDRQDAELKQVRERRDAQINLAKAEASQSDEGKKIIEHQLAILKIRENQTDATKEANRAIEDQEEELRELRKKPLQFNENKTQRDAAIKAQENLVNTLKANRDRIVKTYADQIKAKETEYAKAAEKEIQKLEDDRAQFNLTSANNTRKAFQGLAASSLDLNSYDQQRQSIQFDNDNIDADAETKKLPLQQELTQAEKGLEALNVAISKLPKEMQEAAKNDPLYKLAEGRRDFLKDRIADVDSTTWIQKRTNENRMMKVDRDQARAVQSAINSAEDEVTSLTEQNYRSSLEATNMNPLDITTRVNELSRSNAVAKINRDLEANIANLKESGTWTQELEDKLRAVAAVKIDNLRFQFKDLATLLRDELNQQFKSFFDGLDNSFKSFFTDLISGTKSLGDSFKQLFSSILSQLAQLAVNRLWTQLLGGKGIGGLFQTQSEPGFGGILGLGASLLGAFSGGGAGLAGAFTGASNFGIASGVSLTPFAEGGIVTRATSALIGEAGPEAVIPLSGGRAVGVEFKGRSAIGNSNATVTVEINNNGSHQISSTQGGALGRDLKSTVESVIANHLRPGGMISQAVKG
ncbi:hypothetical protein LEP3755_34190 [Leptolyngbya sp. NIES-3755]|nr:hypothetical protein LEP3755_34190 [Leptolyngbya sp. NIES-3755]